MTGWGMESGSDSWSSIRARVARPPEPQILATSPPFSRSYPSPRVFPPRFPPLPSTSSRLHGRVSERTERGTMRARARLVEMDDSATGRG